MNERNNRKRITQKVNGAPVSIGGYARAVAVNADPDVIYRYATI